jgi:hypothetical protein
MRLQTEAGSEDEITNPELADQIVEAALDVSYE